MAFVVLTPVQRSKKKKAANRKASTAKGKGKTKQKKTQLDPELGKVVLEEGQTFLEPGTLGLWSSSRCLNDRLSTILLGPVWAKYSKFFFWRRGQSSRSYIGTGV